MPSRRSTRLKQGSRKRKHTIPGRISIHQRQAVANDKVQLGHFEADLTFNKGNRSTNIAVMVDKKSQKSFLSLNRCKKAITVSYGLSKRIKEIPANIRRAFTVDNGINLLIGKS